MRPSRFLVQQALSAARNFRGHQQDVLTWGGLRSMAAASGAPATSSSSIGRQVQASLAAIGFGFAAAALGAGSAVAAVATAPAKEETIRLGGLRITASGGATIQHARPEASAKTDTTVVFVLGGPGSGKGTQCARLVEDYGMAHLSAGDLLRAHVKSGTPDGNMVADMIKNGQIVPSEVTIKLLLRAMAETGKQHFLIDGFPRNQENRDAFERMAGYDCSFVLFFDCPEEVLEKRLLGRNEGRTDDNIESIKKRFKVFIESSLPVIEYYEKLGKVRRINTNRPKDEIYRELMTLF